MKAIRARWRVAWRVLGVLLLALPPGVHGQRVESTTSVNPVVNSVEVTGETPDVHEGLRSDIRDLMARQNSLGDDQRAAAELSLAQRLALNSPEAAALYRAVQGIPERRVWLRLMGLSGHRDFLPLVHEALTDPAVSLREEALRVVLLLSDPASADHLRPLLALHPGRKEDKTRMIAALRYFKAHPHRITRKDLRPLFGWQDPAVRMNLLDLLPYFPDEETRRLCRSALRARLLPVQVRGARCLGAMGGRDALEALSGAFAGADEALQVPIVTAVGTTGEEDSGVLAGARLGVWLRHGRVRVALAALLALQKMAPQKAAPSRAVPRLMVLIESGESSLPRGVLIKSLGLYRDPRAVAFLGGRLHRAGTVEKRVLLEALGDTGRLEGQRHLAPYLSDYDITLRKAARNALHAIAGQQLR